MWQNGLDGTCIKGLEKNIFTGSGNLVWPLKEKVSPDGLKTACGTYRWLSHHRRASYQRITFNTIITNTSLCRKIFVWLFFLLCKSHTWKIDFFHGSKVLTINFYSDYPLDDISFFFFLFFLPSLPWYVCGILNYGGVKMLWSDYGRGSKDLNCTLCKNMYVHMLHIFIYHIL